jgi:hypothetical protein
MRNITFCAIFFLVVSCEDKPIGEDPANTNSILGTWLLYENGYSPGGDYIVETIEPELNQTITFRSFHKMTVTIPWLKDFSYYAVLRDDDHQDLVLAFYEHNPGPSPKLSNSNHKYTLVREDGDIKLYFRFCNEGCHLALSRVE